MTVRVGVIGLGFMGATHLRAYARAASDGVDCAVVAVSDRDADRLSGTVVSAGNIGDEATEQLFDPSVVRTYSSIDALLGDPDVDAVSVCTYTDTHVDVAIRALDAGKHVLVEKPVSTSVAEVQRLADAASSSALICMPAMCMRFWPAWAWLQAAIADGRFGAVRSAVFQRLASPPAWADFYADDALTGGALFDLHIHDADFVRWCFGAPTEVVATGTVHHVTAMYRYANGPKHVVAEGGWDHTPGFDFRMRFVVVFESATVDFDLSRDTPLKVFEDGEGRGIDVSDLTGWEAEVQAFVRAVAAGGASPVAIQEAVGVTSMLDETRACLK